MSRLELTLAAVALGYLVDALLGDPPGFPHPVRAMGWLVLCLEPVLRRTARGPRGELLQGAALWALVVGPSALVSWAAVAVAAGIRPGLGLAVQAFGIGVFLARRSLSEEAGWAVYRALRVGDLPAARQAAARVVGRDTAHLDAAEVARASPILRLPRGIAGRRGLQGHQHPRLYGRSQGRTLPLFWASLRPPR